MGLETAPVHAADHNILDDPLGIDEIAGWEGGNPVLVADAPPFVDQKREAQIVIGAKLSDLIQSLAADRKHDQPAGSIGFEDALELRHLFHARPAPGSPKIEQDRVALVVGERIVVALAGSELEVRCGLANLKPAAGAEQ